MKQDEVIIGIILIIVGTIMFFMGDAIKTPWDSRIDIVMYFSAGLVISGLIVSVIGATSEEIKKTVITNKTVTTPTKIIKPTSQDETLNILRTRYAKGEITKEQYEQMKKDLES